MVASVLKLIQKSSLTLLLLQLVLGSHLTIGTRLLFTLFIGDGNVRRTNFGLLSYGLNRQWNCFFTLAGYLLNNFREFLLERGIETGSGRNCII